MHDKINIAGMVWNDYLALQKRYYRLTGGYISKYKMQKHIGKLRSKSPRFAYWKKLVSQTTQLITHKLDDAYQRFFKKLAKRPPKFRKVKLYRSITFTQAGWKLLDNNKLHIQKRTYKFVKHRELEGMIKTVTIKRDSYNRLWVCFSVECEGNFEPRVMTGKTAGLDFGLKTFLTDDTGKTYKSPEFLKQELKTIKQLSRQFSLKQGGSKARKRARYALSRAQIRVSDKRTDSHYKLAHQLCDEFETIYLEDLNIAGMKRLWGRKISD